MTTSGVASLTGAVLLNVHGHLIVGTTTRAAAEKSFGIGIPVNDGWHAYPVAAPGDARLLMLTSYTDDDILRGVELAGADAPVPQRAKVAHAPNFGTFRLLPGMTGIGDPVTRVDRAFAHLVEDPTVAAFCDKTYTARFGTITASVSTSRFGKVLRIAVYAEGAEPFRYPSVDTVPLLP